MLAHLTHAQAAFLTGRSFFPSLIAGPFAHGLHEALDFALASCLIAAGASAMLGKQYFYQAPVGTATSGSGPGVERPPGQCQPTSSCRRPAVPADQPLPATGASGQPANSGPHGNGTAGARGQPHGTIIDKR